MIFLTLEDKRVDLTQATDALVSMRATDDWAGYVIYVRGAGDYHPIVCTGDNLQQAQFHYEAIKQFCNLK